MRRGDFQIASLGVCQLKLIHAYYSAFNSRTDTADMRNMKMHTVENNLKRKQLLKPEFLISLKNRIEKVFDKWECGMYVNQGSHSLEKRLS